MPDMSTIRFQGLRPTIHSAFPPASPRLRSQLPVIGLCLLITFNVAIPKGGIKVSDLPLTWGYLLLLAMTPFAGIGLLGRRNISHAPLIQAFACFLPAAVLIMAKAFLYHLPTQVWAVYMTVFGVLTSAILITLAPYLEDVPAETLGTFLRYAMRFTVLWGLMNFVLHIVTGLFIEIPYVTVNAADVGEIFSKMNNRSGMMKLVSTFNNGNIYGVCMVIMTPMYLLFEKNRIFTGLLFVALVCTLSRTVWFGMVGMGLLMILGGQIRLANPLVWLGLAAGILGVIALMPMMGWTPDKLVDTNLGGRSAYFDTFDFTLLGADHMRVPEMVYFGFAQSFGMLGMLFPLAAMAFAPAYALLNWATLSPLRRAAAIGAASYLIAALIDGAFILPPTFVLFLFASAMVYRRGLHPDARLPMGPAISLDRLHPTLLQPVMAGRLASSRLPVQ